jgi:hypothetical protein
MLSRVCNPQFTHNYPQTLKQIRNSLRLSQWKRAEQQLKEISALLDFSLQEWSGEPVSDSWRAVRVAT